jgi:hypothetical protein
MHTDATSDGADGTTGPGGDDAGDGASEASAPPVPIADAGIPDSSCGDGGGLSSIEQSLLAMPADSWMDLPATDFSTYCKANEDPTVETVQGCNAVITSWSGGAFDGAQHEMLLFGGGHNDYWGNEVYGFDLASGSWKTLRKATTLAGGHAPTEPMYDGTPDSRHTYDGLIYIEQFQQLMAWGGASAPSGFSVNTAWMFDPVGGAWTPRSPTPGDQDGHFFMGSAYDSVTGHVFVRDEQGIWEYDPGADSWTWLVNYGYAPYYPTYSTSNYRRAVVAPQKRLLYALGGKLASGAPDVVVFDIAQGKDVTSTVTMAGDVSTIAASGPGLDFDRAANELVAWSGGAVAIMDLTTTTWTRGTATSAPATPVSQGTYGRFRYIPYLNVFILVNEPTENVHFYKHTASCGL